LRSNRLDGGVAIVVSGARAKTKARDGEGSVSSRVTGTFAERSVTGVLQGAKLLPRIVKRRGVAIEGRRNVGSSKVANLGGPVGSVTFASSVSDFQIDAGLLSRNNGNKDQSNSKNGLHLKRKIVKS
jgi:hypothetical protein